MFLAPFMNRLKIQLIELSFTLYLFLCLQLSVKTSSTLVHPHVGNSAARTSVHFQYPWLLYTNSFHVHPWALACLSPSSICLDSNVPACGWLDTWHGIESPNNARGLHGQTAFHSQRHLFWWWGSSLWKSEWHVPPLYLIIPVEIWMPKPIENQKSQKENEK